MTAQHSLSRNLPALADQEFDIVVVGGGIAGACAAWDAALRGLSVALVERDDFGGATSAQSLKILHGGIRYLQHLDIVRLRESCRERSAFIRSAPHVAGPLPFAIPTYGHGMRGKEVLAAAFTVLRVLTVDRNRGIADLARRLPVGRIITRQECLQHFPDLNRDGLTGAAVFYDGHLYNPPRAVLAVVRAAAAAGARVANYVAVTDFLREDGRVSGVRVRDALSGDTFDIRAGVTINATGPYAEALLMRAGLVPKLTVPLSRDMAFVIRRRYASDMAVAIQTGYRDPDAVLSRGSRHLFLVPWRGYTHIGVNSKVFNDDPDALHVPEQEIDGFLAEINAACPSFGLTRDDILAVNAGLLPFGENAEGASDLSFGKRSHITDHRVSHGLAGLVSAMSVRWTTGRLVGERAVDLALVQLGQKTQRCRTAVTPVYGGGIGTFDDLVSSLTARLPQGSPAGLAVHLARNHGSAAREVLQLLGDRPELCTRVGNSDVTYAEVLHAVRHEMAMKLGDVVQRRTDLGSGEYPGEPAVRDCATLMGREFGWTRTRIEEEMAEVSELLERPATGFQLTPAATAGKPS